MTDSPAVRVPLDPREQPILDNLLSIRTQLVLMKQDKSCFVKTDVVMRLYSETVAQVHLLNNIRTDKREEQNRVDTVLDDCLQLLSLAFMTIGKNSEIPAMYSVVSTIKRLLDHLKEAAFFSTKDLEMILQQLNNFTDNIARGRDRHDAHLVTLLEARIDICHTLIKDLQQNLEGLNPECLPVYEQLVSILRSLSACNVRSTYPKEEVDELREQIRQIQKKVGREDVVGSPDALMEQYAETIRDIAGNPSSSPNQAVNDLMTRCLLWAELIESRHGRIADGFKQLFDKLLAIRNGLESRSLLQAWSMRETDLYSFQRQLDRIDESRTEDGNFIDAQGNKADLQTQRTLLYLLRKSYALIYLLLTASEPVSEALLPTFNQLKTLRKCLREVQKAGGISSPRELYPYKMKLNSVDKMRVDGKFMVNNNVPEGQAAIMQLMEDCYELMDELQNEAEDSDTDDAHDDTPPVQPQAISAT